MLKQNELCLESGKEQAQGGDLTLGTSSKAGLGQSEGGMCVGVNCGGGQQVETTNLRGKKEIIIKVTCYVFAICCREKHYLVAPQSPLFWLHGSLLVSEF